MDYCLNFSSIAFGHEVVDLFRLFGIVVNTSDGQDTAEGAEEGFIRFLGVPRLSYRGLRSGLSRAIRRIRRRSPPLHAPTSELCNLAPSPYSFYH